MEKDKILYDIELRKISFIKRFFLAIKIILGEPVYLRLNEKGLSFVVGGKNAKE